MIAKKSKGKEGKEVEGTYKTKIKFLCPTRGWVEQEVSIKKFKAVEAPANSILDSELEELMDKTYDDGSAEEA